MTTILALLRRETLLNWQQGGSGWLSLGFFLLVATLYVFAIGVKSQLLAHLGGSAIWVGAVFSSLLTLDRLFALDYEDGSLDLLLTSPVSKLTLAFCKALAHWLNTLAPLIAIAPALALLFNLSSESITTIVLSLLLGTPALSFIGAVVSALTASVKRGAALIPLVALPLYVPSVIFGAGALTGDSNASASLYYLSALSVFWVAVAPVAVAGALSAATDY